MAGYTDSAFRILCRDLGADVVVTELISADAIFHTAKNWYQDEAGEWQSKKACPEHGRGRVDETLQMLKFTSRERPVVIQLFGKYPEKFAFAARWISENLKPDGIDINMGCPARKVVGSDHGAALLKNPDLACQIVRAVKENTDLPVSVKTRLGWDNDDQILQFAPLLWRAGISAIMIHGRTYKDGFKNIARWENIYKVRENLPELIVIGNGDIRSNADIKLRLYHPATPPRLGGEWEGIDGIAIGRATFGKPWIFQKDEITNEELKIIALQHAKLAFEFKGEFGIIEFRKHLLSYIKGFPGASALRVKAVSVVDFQSVKDIIGQLGM